MLNDLLFLRQGLRFKQTVLIGLCFGLMGLNAMVAAQSTFSKIKDFLPHLPPEDQFLTAIKQDNVGFVKNLLDAGVGVNTQDKAFPRHSGLHYAAWENAHKSLMLLLSYQDIQIDVLNAVDETPLMIAALKGHIVILEALLKAGAYPNKTGWTALHYAATSGNIPAMQALIEAHAFIDAESPNKTTPLMMAARSKHILAVKFLLDEGADATLKNELNFTAIDFADKAGAKDIADGLRERVKKIAERSNKPAWLR